jgi:hypothetical protein
MIASFPGDGAVVEQAARRRQFVLSLPTVVENPVPPSVRRFTRIMIL